MLSRPPTDESVAAVGVSVREPVPSNFDGDDYFAPVVKIVRDGMAAPSASLRQRAARFVWRDDCLFLREGMRRCVAGKEQRVRVLQEAHDAPAAYWGLQASRQTMREEQSRDCQLD